MAADIAWVLLGSLAPITPVVGFAVLVNGPEQDAVGVAVTLTALVVGCALAVALTRCLIDRRVLAASEEVQAALGPALRLDRDAVAVVREVCTSGRAAVVFGRDETTGAPVVVTITGGRVLVVNATVVEAGRSPVGGLEEV